MRRIDQEFSRICLKYPKLISTVSSDGNELSYNDLYQKACRLSDALRQSNLGEGDHVGIYFPNGPDFVVSYFAAQMIGAIGVLISSSFRSWDLSKALSFCDVSAVIASHDLTARIENRQSIRPYSQQIDIVLMEHRKPMLFMPVGEERIADEPAIIIPTSGSTGGFKAVVLGHNGILANANAFINHLKQTKYDSSLVALPLTSSFAHTTQMIAQLILGGRLIFGDKIFLPRIFLRLIREQKPSITGLVPSMLQQILDRFDTDSKEPLVKIIVIAGAPIPNNLMELAAHKIPGTILVKAYGLTEAGPRVSQLHPDDYKSHQNSVGKPLPGVQLKIIDDLGNPIENGNCGEIAVKSPSNMLGYYSSPGMTAATLTKGWLKTGDLGKIDSDGYLYILGRKKNLIIKGGIKIHPEEIEEFLLSLPGVHECLVNSQPDDAYGEKIVAKVVVGPDSRLDAAELIEFCRKNLSPIKVPDSVILVSSIDKTITGKVVRSMKSEILAEPTGSTTYQGQIR